MTEFECTTCEPAIPWAKDVERDFDITYDSGSQLGYRGTFEYPEKALGTLLFSDLDVFKLIDSS